MCHSLIVIDVAKTIADFDNLCQGEFEKQYISKKIMIFH